MSDENENSQPNAITPVVRAFEAHSSGFSKRTLDLSPTETLIFVNNFFAWISAGALKERPSIVDKYIGDEIMVVFSKECCLGRPGLPPTVGKSATSGMICVWSLALAPAVRMAKGAPCLSTKERMFAAFFAAIRRARPGLWASAKSTAIDAIDDDGIGVEFVRLSEQVQEVGMEAVPNAQLLPATAASMGGFAGAAHFP